MMRLSRGFDPVCTDGKRRTLRERVQVLVVGAGHAGCAAALEAARLGLKVALVDENPVDPALIGLEVPFHFGGRMTGAVRNRNAMTETIVANDPALGEAFEAGVDVRLGVAVWGLVRPRPGVAWVGRRAAGLTDGAESWFCGFDAAILATGRRDVGVAFPGWNLPGVMGATAAHHLLRRYDALEGRTFVMLGSGTEATALAEALRSSGRTVAAIVEAASEAIDAAGCGRLAASGVEILAGSMIRRALGRDGVEGAAIIRLDDAESETAIACDTIVLATGAAPAIELFDIAGAAIVFRPESSGHLPPVDPDGRTTELRLFGAGDCIGIKADPPEAAAAEGIRAARAAAQALAAGRDAGWMKPVEDERPAEQAPSSRLIWARAARSVAEADTHMCQCEEVSLHDLLGFRPPRYLNRDQPTQRARDPASLASEGRINQDQVKRLTRAGMGPCQGRRCREQVGAALGEATGVALGAIPLPSYRAPVRPLPLATFADQAEEPAIAEHWDGWFGIESQWVPFWEPLPAMDEESGR